MIYLNFSQSFPKLSFIKDEKKERKKLKKYKEKKKKRKTYEEKLKLKVIEISWLFKSQGHRKIQAT